MRQPSVRRRRKALICCGICMALTVGIAAYTLFLSWGEPNAEAVGSSGQTPDLDCPSVLPEDSEFLRTEPVEVDGIDPSLPVIALTVDDSVTALTHEYCRVMEENGCAATFFTVGYLAEEEPETLKVLAEAGMEIGNHSYSHQQLVGLSGEKIWQQVSRADELLEQLSGEAPALIRPPYGRVNQDVLDAAGHPVILWSVDAQDAVASSSDEVLNRLLSAEDGDIVRVHDGIPLTLDALEEGLPVLREAGIQVTTVSNLFAVRGYVLQDGRKYRALPAE